jgi:salicylate hydroxylase
MFISSAKLRELGLRHTVKESALQFWVSIGIDRFVAGPGRDRKILRCYTFYPAEKTELREGGWHLEASPQQLLEKFPGLDPDVQNSSRMPRILNSGGCSYAPEYPY